MQWPRYANSSAPARGHVRPRLWRKHQRRALARRVRGGGACRHGPRQAAVKAAAESRPIGAARLRAISLSFSLPLEDWPSAEDCQRELGEAESRLAQAERKEADEQRRWYLRDNVLCLRELLGKAKRAEPAALRFEINLLAVEMSSAC